MKCGIIKAISDGRLKEALRMLEQCYKTDATVVIPSSYTPESVKEKRISFDVELVQIVPVYYFPVNPDVDLNFTALYNYNDSVRDIAGADVKLGDRFLLQAGVEKSF